MFKKILFIFQIVLLDFGACNDYSPEFVDTYMKIIKGSSEQDREAVLKYSQELGFLTGFETKVLSLFESVNFNLVFFF